MNFILVRKVRPLNDMKVLIRFENGKEKIYDVKIWLDKVQCFQALKKEKGLFEKVHIIAGGAAIAWNNELDLACNELWEQGMDNQQEAV